MEWTHEQDISIAPGAVAPAMVIGILSGDDQYPYTNADLDMGAVVSDLRAKVPLLP